MPVMVITLTSLVLVCTSFIISLITVEQTVLVLFFNMTVLAFHMMLILVLDLLIAIKERPKAKAKIRISNNAMNALWKESAKNGWAEVRELKEKVNLLKTSVKIAEEENQSLTNRLRERVNELYALKHDIEISNA